MSNLRFFADHCVSNFIIEEFGNYGYEVLILREHIPQDSSDTIVILKAQEFNSILISLNGDFADIVSYPPSIYNGIIALQVKNRPELIPEILKRLKKYLLEHPDMNHYRGKLFIVDTYRIRIKE